MFDQLGSAIETLKSCVAFDAAALDGDAAMELCARFAEVERLGAAGKLAAAGRVAATEVWRRGGWRTAADWLARQSGADPGRAREGLETAGQLADHPVVATEIRAGRLSEAQAHVIVDAAGVRPDAEGRLVEFARTNSLRRLREECRRVKVGDVSADEEYQAVHRSRVFRSWIGRDGAVCGNFRYTPDTGGSSWRPSKRGKTSSCERGRAMDGGSRSMPTPLMRWWSWSPRSAAPSSVRLPRNGW